MNPNKNENLIFKIEKDLVGTQTTKPNFITLASFANIWRAQPSVQIKPDHNNEFEQHY